MAKDWETEWFDMPEFVQKKQRAYAQIIFRFETEEDLEEFSILIGQKLTSKTKSAWHPHKPHVKPYKYEWVQEDET